MGVTKVCFPGLSSIVSQKNFNNLNDDLYSNGQAQQNHIQESVHEGGSQLFIPEGETKLSNVAGVFLRCWHSASEIGSAATILHIVCKGSYTLNGMM